MYNNGLFIFRRDFRIVDNKTLNAMNSECKNIYTIFIFTPEQVSGANKYKSDNSVQFMIESLEDLNDQIKKSGGKLLTFYGNNDKVIEYCIDRLNINVVGFNMDYSPYAIDRDESILKICEKKEIPVIMEHDYYLNAPGTIENGSGNEYQKFTPYYNVASKRRIDSPAAARKLKLVGFSGQLTNSISLQTAFSRFTKENDDILVDGGRGNAIKVLKTEVRTQKQYSKTHDDLAKQTSQLSAYIKFGCVSIREVYNVFKSNKPFIRQLIWRDFYANILYAFPYVLGKPMKASYSKISWSKNTGYFNAWKNGMTGFPIVDAAMRQLNETGYMHNRGRLIVASFLVKTLLIDWREGEKYFATQLTDYDPASNNGNWQWIASSGADSQPYFRIFNPWSQSADNDPDAEYIKKWIPELEDVPAKDIHNWDKTYQDYKGSVKYPKPIVDYSTQKDKALAMFKKAFS